MANETNSMGEVIMKGLLFLGIFSVATDGGKNEYVFDIGFNLSLVLIIITLMIAILIIMEIRMLIVDELAKAD